MITLPINEIKVENRQRQDYGNLDELANSLAQYGLIQPVVINQDKRLIAGGRRLAAAVKLGWVNISVVYRETLTEDELHLMELEENIRRLDMSWQERVLNIATIHRIKKQQAALESKAWGQRHTAEALGLDGHASVNYSLQIAERLVNKDDVLWQCTSMMDAWRTIMKENETAALAELARRQTASIVVEEAPPVQFDDFVSDPSDNNQPNPHLDALRDRARGKGYLTMNIEEQRSLYLSNPLNLPEQFDAYREQRIAWLSQQEETINLTSMLIKGDSVAYMQENTGCFDHIITDIPYGIDMEMLNQQNPHGGMKDIDTVEAEHTVEGNIQLFHQFFPAAYGALKENGYCITWCDIMNWQLMYDLAIKAGFKVTRWPITWNKTHSCMNQTAQFNFTKSTEIAIVCRKGRATLVKPQATCVVSASRDELCDALGHPFAKPYEVWRFLVEAVSIEGQLILEPFAGRGSGVISLLRLKRNVVGVELNDAHYNALLENVKTQHFLKLNPKLKFK